LSNQRKGVIEVMMEFLAGWSDFDQLHRCGTDPAKDGWRRRHPTHRQAVFLCHVGELFRFAS
jgi:hypothetical protein